MSIYSTLVASFDNSWLSAAPGRRPTSSREGDDNFFWNKFEAAEAGYNEMEGMMKTTSEVVNVSIEES